MPESWYAPLLRAETAPAHGRSLATALAGVLGVTLVGGVAAAASFPARPTAIACPVAVPSAVAVLAPVVDGPSALGRMVDPGGTWRADGTSGGSGSVSIPKGSGHRFGGEQTWFDDQGRHLTVDILALDPVPTGDDVKQLINGEAVTDLVRSDDGLWSSRFAQGAPAVRLAVGVQAGLVVEVILDGDPQPASAEEVLGLVRTQMKNLPTTPAGTSSGAAPVALRLAPSPSTSASAAPTAPSPRCKPHA